MDASELLRQISSSSADNIKTVMENLNAFLARPESFIELMNILKTSADPVVRNSACVFIRKKVRAWDKWDIPTRTSFEAELMNLLESEKDPTTLRSIVRITVPVFIMSHGSDQQWNDLLVFVEKNSTSSDVSKRELSFDILCALATDCPEILSSFIQPVVNTILVGYADPDSFNVRYNALKSASNMLFCVTREDAFVFAPCLSKAADVIKSLINNIKVFDTNPFIIFSEALEYSYLSNYFDIKSTLELSLLIACSEVDEEIKKFSLNYVIDVIRLKSAVISMLNAAESIVVPVYKMMCAYEASEHDNDSLFHICSQVIDMLSQRLSSSTFVPILQSCIEPGFTNENQYVRRAAMLALAVSMEGCCRFYADYCLERVLNIILNAINDPQPMVAFTGVFALAELLSYESPYANDYAKTFMPVILETLTKVSGVHYESVEEDMQLWVSRAFYALEEACNCLVIHQTHSEKSRSYDLDNQLIEYMPDLMSKLMAIHDVTTSPRMHEFVLEAMSFAVIAIDKLVAPYVPCLFEIISKYLSQERNDSNTPLFCKALEVLSSIFRYVDTPETRAHANESAKYAMTILQSDEDEPDLKSSAYEVMAALTFLYKENMDPVLLKSLIDCAIATFKSNEGLMIVTSDEESTDEEEDDLDEEENEDDDGTFVDSVETSYADERVSALTLISDLATNCENLLAPYTNQIYDLICKNSDLPNENIQSQALKTAASVCVAFHNVYNGQNSEEVTKYLRSMVTTLFNEIQMKVLENENHSTIIYALNAVQDLLSGLESTFFSFVSVKDVADLILQVFTRKIACLKSAADEKVEIEEPELDGQVIEAAGEIIPVVAPAVPSDVFKELFLPLLDILLKQLNNSNTAKKSFIIATVATTMANMDELLFAPDFLYKLFDAFLLDESDEVAQNSCYGMGLLIIKAPEELKNNIQDVLTKLHNLCQRTQNEAESPLRDNVCGCACRILYAYQMMCPVEAIVEFVMNLLPLRVDKENYGAVFAAVMSLATNSVLDRHIPTLLDLACAVILEDDEEVTDDHKKVCASFLKTRALMDNTAVMNAVNKLPDKERQDVLNYMSKVEEA